MTGSPSQERLTPERVVGIRLRQARERIGATQAQVGEWLLPLLGKPWPRQAVYAAEHGGRALTVSELMALATVLDVSPTALLIPPAEAEYVYLPGLMLPVSVRDLFHREDAAGGPGEALRQVAQAARTIAIESEQIIQTIERSGT